MASLSRNTVVSKVAGTTEHGRSTKIRNNMRWVLSLLRHIVDRIDTRLGAVAYAASVSGAPVRLVYHPVSCLCSVYVPQSERVICWSLIPLLCQCHVSGAPALF